MSIKDIIIGHTQSTVRKFRNVLGGKAGELEVDQIQSSNKSSQIEWHNYNYPPFLRLYHLPSNGQGLKDPAKSTIRKMKFAQSFIFYVSIINFMNNCIQKSSDCSLITAKSIGFSVLNIFIWPCIANLSFYYGLYGIMQDPNSNPSRNLNIYKISQVVLSIVWFIFTILGDQGYNGWMKLNVFSKCQNSVNVGGQNNFGFSIFLMVVEILLYYASIALGLFSCFKIMKDPLITQDPFEDQQEIQIQTQSSQLPNYQEGTDNDLKNPDQEFNKQ